MYDTHCDLFVAFHPHCMNGCEFAGLTPAIESLELVEIA